MTKEELLTRQSAIEQRFEELTKNRTEIDDELKRLQGEHRLVLELIEASQTTDEKPGKRLRKVVEEENAQD